MKKVFGYILSPIYLLVLGTLLGIFYPIQVVCWNLWGYPAQKRAAEFMCYLIFKSLVILGSRIKFIGFEKLPEDEKSELRRFFITPMMCTRNMGQNASTELAFKLGSFLNTHDPGNEMGKLFKKDTGGHK